MVRQVVVLVVQGQQVAVRRGHYGAIHVVSGGTFLGSVLKGRGIWRRRLLFARDRVVPRLVEVLVAVVVVMVAGLYHVLQFVP